MNKIIFLLLLLLCGLCRAGDLAFRHYSVADGLASSTVYSGIQDKDGYIWLATESGVNRFNGRTFELFTTDDGLADNDILRVFQDSKGRIWFLSFNGQFSYFLNGKIFNGQNTPFLKSAYCAESFIEIHEDAKGRLWFSGYGNNLVMIDGQKVKQFTLPPRFYNRGGLNVVLRENGMPEFRVGKEIYRYDETKRKLVFIRTSAIQYLVQRPVFSEKGLSFDVVLDGIGLTSGNTEKLILKRKNDVSIFYHNTLYHDSDDFVWLGTMGDGLEIYRFENDTLTLYKKCLPDANVVNIFRDHERNFWFCTKDNGLYMLPDFGTEVTLLRKSEKLPSENLYSVHLDRSGKLWFGGEREAVGCRDVNGEVQVFNLSNSGQYNFRVNDIDEDDAGNIWLATNEFIYRISVKGKIDTVLSVNRKYFGPKAGKYLAVDDSGVVYLAYYSGIAKLNKTFGAFELLDGVPFPLRIYSVHCFASKLYVASFDGLNEYHNGKLVPLYFNDRRLTGRVNAMTNFGDSLLVVSVSGAGICVLKDNKVIGQYTKNDGLPSNECRRVFAEGKNLWVATNRGLAKCRIESTSRLSGWTVFSANNMLAGSDVRDVDVNSDMVYVATSAGLHIFKDPGFPIMSDPPRLHVKSFAVNDMSMVLDTVYYLQHDENNLQINFETISFNSVDQVDCQYQLEESGLEWKSMAGSQLIITKLLPGNYTLKFRAKIKDGNWSQVQNIRIFIQLPFWKSNWFTILAILLAGGLISIPVIFYLFYRNRIVKMELKQQTALHQERLRISHDLHDDLGGSLTSISMNAKIIKHKKQAALDFDAEISDIEHESAAAVDKFSDIVWAISASQDYLHGLVSFLNEYVDKFASYTGLECKKTIDYNADLLSMGPDIRRNIMLIVKEALNNIRKHAGATSFEFELSFKEGQLVISIEDNGIGFDIHEPDERGIGLMSMQSRASSIGGVLVFGAVKPQGTSVVFYYNSTS